MNQQHFVQQAQKRWDTFEALLRVSQVNRSRDAALPEFSHLYRGVCRDLALARQRQFDAPLVDYLNGLVLHAHQIFYADSRPSWRRIVEFLAFDFPRAVRREKKLILFMHLVFYGSALLVAALVLWRPEYVYALLDPGTVRNMERMYDPSAKHFLQERGFDGDADMFGFYIYNNISIAFKTFAGGVLFGVGSLFLLLFNGLHLGAVFGHLINVGYWRTIGTFVIGHGSLELTAIIFSAAAGMRLGWSMVAPGKYTRIEALRRAGRQAISIIYGSAIMLVGAATLEGFWSGNIHIPDILKLVFGAAGWIALLSYFLLAGRSLARQKSVGSSHGH